MGEAGEGITQSYKLLAIHASTKQNISFLFGRPGFPLGRFLFLETPV